MQRSLPLLLAVAMLAAGCDTTTTPQPVAPTTPPLPLTTQTFTGTVAVGGSSSNTFVVAQSGDVVITIVALGPPPNIVMGLAVGKPSTTDSSCATQDASTLNVQASTPPLAGSLAAGSYCLKIYDLNNQTQTAPVNYTISVAHH